MKTTISVLAFATLAGVWNGENSPTLKKSNLTLRFPSSRLFNSQEQCRLPLDRHKHQAQPLLFLPLPKLVKFAVQGQQQFAWVDLQFLLWQSQIDPQTGQLQQGVPLDPATNQPRMHHLTVLLLRVPPKNVGTNPAMGGTGWLVSNYGLDLPNGTSLEIVQPA